MCSCDTVSLFSVSICSPLRVVVLQVATESALIYRQVVLLVQAAAPCLKEGLVRIMFRQKQYIVQYSLYTAVLAWPLLSSKQYLLCRDVCSLGDV
jgi:hypothetical protein